MGGLVSRRKKGKIEARNVLSQATDSTKAARQEVEPKDNTTATDPGVAIQAAAKELNIGEGHSLDFQNRQNQSGVITIRTIKENKKRKGISSVQQEPPTSTRVTGPTPGIDFSTQTDLLSLPGQVSSGFRSPVKDNSSRFPQCEETGGDPGDSIDFSVTCPPSLQKRKESVFRKYIGIKKASSRPRIKLEPVHDIQEQENPSEVEQDENSNILKEGQLLAELRNRELYGACTDEELLSYMQRPSQAGYNPESKKGGGEHDSSDQSARRQRKKTVTYSEDSKPSALESSRLGILEATPEFRLSLEQILQTSVPFDLETLEVAAVTGTGSARQTLPPPGGYTACWSTEVPLQDGSTCTEPIENDYHPGIEYIDGEASIADGEAREVGVDEDIAEDTLDWNVDDRVRSPSDSRSDSANMSDEDGEDVDPLVDCSIDVVPPIDGQRQTSLTTLKDGDSAGGAIYSPPTQSSTTRSQPSRPQDILATAAMQPSNNATTVTGTQQQLGTAVSTRQPSDTAVTDNATRQSSSTAARAALSQQPMNLYITAINTKQCELNKAQGEMKPKAGRDVDGVASMKIAHPTQDRAEDRSGPTVDKRIKETGKILMDICGTTSDGQPKSLIEIQEAEAMTLLLLTGTLPGEEGGGVTRGAGDAAEAAISEESVEAGERAGLAVMLDTRSKSSCQLEQIQNQVEVDSAVLNSQRSKQPADSSAAAAQTPHHTLKASSTAAVHKAKSISAQEEAEGSRQIQGDTNRRQGVAEGSLLEGKDGGALMQSQRATSPGAASTEGDWQVIPLRRIPGQTHIGASEANVTSEAAGQQPGALEAQENVANNCMPATPGGLSSPSVNDHQSQDSGCESTTKEAAIEEKVGAGDSPRRKSKAASVSGDSVTGRQENQNQNANRAVCYTGRQRQPPKADNPRRFSTRKKRKSGGIASVYRPRE